MSSDRRDDGAITSETTRCRRSKCRTTAGCCSTQIAQSSCLRDCPGPIFKAGRVNHRNVRPATVRYHQVRDERMRTADPFIGRARHAVQYWPAASRREHGRPARCPNCGRLLEPGTDAGGQGDVRGEYAGAGEDDLEIGPGDGAHCDRRPHPAPAWPGLRRRGLASMRALQEASAHERFAMSSTDVPGLRIDVGTRYPPAPTREPRGLRRHGSNAHADRAG